MATGITLVLALVLVFLGAYALAPRRARASGKPPSLSGLSVLTPCGQGALVPAFSPGKTDYRLGVDGDVTGLAVVADLPGGSKARLAVNGKKARAGALTVIALPVGASRIEVLVRAPGGRKQVYAVAVERADQRPIADRFLRLTHVDPETGVTMGYRLFVPDGYDSAKSYPLVLFLHGAGESGKDNEVHITSSKGATVWARPDEQARHPCFVLAPQSEKEEPKAGGRFGRVGWTSLMGHGATPTDAGTPFEPQAQLTTVFHILEKVLCEYTVDRRRVYLTGLSMGGFGTFTLAMQHPKTFAALVPIASGGDPSRLALIAGTPIWAFHGEDDPVVPVKLSRDSIQALRAAGGNPRYTEFPKGTFLPPSPHFSWVPAYANSEMRSWLFDQLRADTEFLSQGTPGISAGKELG